MSARSWRSRRSSSHKPARARSRVLRSESLEPRALLSGSGLSGITGGLAAMVGAPAPANAAPTVAQGIIVNNNAPVTGKTASLSVVGSDDGGEARLTYIWSVTAAPVGGTARFNLNGTNAAKFATATFTKAGNYGLTVKIVDASGLSVSSVKTVVVSPTLTSVGLITSSGQTVSPGSTLAVSGVTQVISAQGLDQFGNALASSPVITWSRTTMPSGAPTPTLFTSGNAAALTFGKAGTYGLAVQAKGGNISVSTNVSMSVVQVLSSLKNASTAAVYVSGTSLQPTIATFCDQFGNALSVQPTLTWSTSSQPQGAPAPTFTTSGGVTKVAFGMAGNYMLTARAVNMPNASFVTVVVVNQTLTSIAVSPNTYKVFQGADQQFAAQGFDQFGRAMVAPQTFTWSASGGTINASGRYTAASNLLGGYTVTARSGAVTGVASVTIAANTGSLQNAALATLVQNLDADGSISRQDMMQLLRSVGADGLVNAAEFADLKTILTRATTLNIPSYVQVLASDVINGNLANATFQGQALGNLAAGSSAAQLNKLVDKWFLGADHPTLCNSSVVYRSTAGSLFPHAPSHLDEYQGQLGDCYFISALGTLADSNQAAVRNMFIDNGDGTFTVRFYTGTYGTIYNYSDGSISAGFTNNCGTADYVTVDRMLPTTSTGILAYADYGANYANAANSLWIPLAEKAYAQWNQTGKEGRDGLNAYASIQGGWMGTVDAQVLGYNATDYLMPSTGKQVAINALAAKKAVTIGTLSWSGTNLGLYPSHAYAIVGYNASTDRFTLYNPWGSNQPGPLSWSQLQATCTQLVVCSTAGSVSISSAMGKAGAVQSAFSTGVVEIVASTLPGRPADTLPSESADASLASDLTAAAAPERDASTVDHVSRELFETLANSLAASSHQTRLARPAHGALPASLVDAAFAPEGWLSQSDEWATLFV